MSSNSSLRKTNTWKAIENVKNLFCQVSRPICDESFEKWKKKLNSVFESYLSLLLRPDF